MIYQHLYVGKTGEKEKIEEYLWFSAFNTASVHRGRIFHSIPNRRTRIYNLQKNMVSMYQDVYSILVEHSSLTVRFMLSISQDDCVRLFVGLPLDCYSQQNARAIAVGLKALKLLGVEGVELPMWWGIVEKEGPCKYDWSSYLSLAKMVQDVGLKLHVSLGFHATEDRTAALPQWVSRIGETQPDIFFTDHSGRRYKKCLSLAVDDLPVLEGRTPMQVYEQFFESFRSSFADFMGSTITVSKSSLWSLENLKFV